MKNAWHNDKILPEQMVKGARGELPGFSKLEYSSHFLSLDSLVKIADPKNITELGCGSGEIGRIYNHIKYIGCDLPHIIDKVSMIVNPILDYIKFDADDLDYDFLKDNIDLLLMNGFLSELENPLQVLKKIIEKKSKFILIHRQIFSQDKSKLMNATTYGNLESKTAVINFSQFLEEIKNKYDISEMFYSFDHNRIKSIESINFSESISILLKIN
jgi:trans-aconitate methyltransferase